MTFRHVALCCSSLPGCVAAVSHDPPVSRFRATRKPELVGRSAVSGFLCLLHLSAEAEQDGNHGSAPPSATHLRGPGARGGHSFFATSAFNPHAGAVFPRLLQMTATHLLTGDVTEHQATHLLLTSFTGTKKKASEAESPVSVRPA